MADGRFALITGGAQGIGFATARRFLELGFGRVMLLDRNILKLQERAAKLKTPGRGGSLRRRKDVADGRGPSRWFRTAEMYEPHDRHS